MNKTFLIVLIIIVLGGAAVVIVSVSGGNDQAANDNSSTNEAMLNTSAGDAMANSAVSNESAMSNSTASFDESKMSGESGVEVSASSSGFSPGTVTINVGDSVTWTNVGSSQVYIAPNNHPTHVAYAGIWDDDGTGLISAGQTYTQVFKTAGTYNYHDHLNASHTGTVIVK